MAGVNTRYSLEERRIFMDSSTHSLKALLLHKGNILPLVPVACTIYKKETY